MTELRIARFWCEACDIARTVVRDSQIPDGDICCSRCGGVAVPSGGDDADSKFCDECSNTLRAGRCINPKCRAAEQ